MDEERYNLLYNRILDGENWDYSTLDELLALSEADGYEQAKSDLMKEADITQHNYTDRLNDLNREIANILRDFTQKHRLEKGCLYKVIQSDGTCFNAFFKNLELSTYRSTLDFWLAFYKMKKDGNPSKVETGTHMTHIADIVLLSH